MKHLFYISICILLLAGCAGTKKASKAPVADYTAEEVELYGYGVGKSTDENTARGMAMTVSLGDLSVKLQAKVRTAASNYQKQSGDFNKTLYESLSEVVSENRLQGVAFSGDKAPASRKNGVYEYRVTARINQVILRETVGGILDRYSSVEEERDAFRREMFGD